MTDGNVINWGGVTKQDLPVERVLNAAVSANLEPAIVIGEREDGELYFASSAADLRQVLWLLELAKARVMDMARESE